MLQSLYAASSGMEAAQTQFNAISNDLANMDTPGYQATDVGFQSLLYSGGGVSTGSRTTTGTGASASIIGRSQAQGTLQQTGRSLDVAIGGAGFLQVRRSDGSTGLTRNGALALGADGQVTDSAGDPLVPPLQVPKGTDPSALKIAADGNVTNGARSIGQIKLVDVPAPNQLLPAGNSTFSVTAASGAARPATGATLQQGALESSNVDMNSEMAEMINAQRTYQMAGQAVQYQDQMLQIANQLKHS